MSNNRIILFVLFRYYARQHRPDVLHVLGDLAVYQKHPEHVVPEEAFQDSAVDARCQGEH